MAEADRSRVAHFLLGALAYGALFFVSFVLTLSSLRFDGGLDMLYVIALQVPLVFGGCYLIGRFTGRGRPSPWVFTLAQWYLGSRVGILVAVAIWATLSTSAPYVLSLGLLPAGGSAWSLEQANFALVSNAIAAGLAILGARRGARPSRRSEQAPQPDAP